jgi:predicted chitinase
LKSNNENFFNYVYGPKGAGPGLSNTQPGDGYKYRGRGFNQITGRGNYKAYGLESNPDKMNDVEGAADAAIAFLAKEGSALNNKFSSLDNAIEFFVTRNAGGRKKPGEERKARKVTEGSILVKSRQLTIQMLRVMEGLKRLTNQKKIKKLN